MACPKKKGVLVMNTNVSEFGKDNGLVLLYIGIWHCDNRLLLSLEHTGNLFGRFVLYELLCDEPQEISPHEPNAIHRSDSLHVPSSPHFSSIISISASIFVNMPAHRAHILSKSAGDFAK